MWKKLVALKNSLHITKSNINENEWKVIRFGGGHHDHTGTYICANSKMLIGLSKKINSAHSQNLITTL